MELNPNQYAETMRRFPLLELSYETVAHKKVPENYSICLAIPQGKKVFMWFSFFRDEDVCYYMEIGKDKKVGRINIIERNIPCKLAYGTLLYGSIYEEEKFFVIEDIFYCEGVPLKKNTFAERLGFIDAMFRNYSDVFTKFKEFCFVLPVMWNRTIESSDDSKIPADISARISYSIHHLQYRELNVISPYLNVSVVKKIGNSVAPGIDTMLLFIPPAIPRYDFSKPQYKMSAVFEIKADIQYDIYHLYAYGEKCKKIYYGLAYIPNYKTSAFMNGIFRNIRENKNLDAIEESDDEDDFQDSRIDKYVDLKKTVSIECVFSQKFKRWTPVRTVKMGPNTKIVHIGKL